MVILKNHPPFLNKLIFKGNIFSLIKLSNISRAVFMSLLINLNSKKCKSKYPNTIWWIIPYIMSGSWKTNTNKPLMTLNRVETYFESCFWPMVYLICICTDIAGNLKRIFGKQFQYRSALITETHSFHQGCYGIGIGIRVVSDNFKKYRISGTF